MTRYKMKYPKRFFFFIVSVIAIIISIFVIKGICDCFPKSQTGKVTQDTTPINSPSDKSKYNSPAEKTDNTALPVTNTTTSENKTNAENTITTNTEVKNNNTSSGTDTAENKASTAKINSSFFKGSLFIGDSITKGIDDFDLIDDAHFIASNGLTIPKAKDNLSSISKIQPGKVFILLGPNDLLTGIKVEKFVSDYFDLIDSIHSKAPRSQIYIQSIFPVTEEVDKSRPLLSNARINEVNSALKAAAGQHNARFLNVSSVFKDGSGCMHEGYTADGIHIKFNYYNLWLDYLQNNAK